MQTLGCTVRSHSLAGAQRNWRRDLTVDKKSLKGIPHIGVGRTDGVNRQSCRPQHTSRTIGEGVDALGVQLVAVDGAQHVANIPPTRERLELAVACPMRCRHARTTPRHLGKFPTQATRSNEGIRQAQDPLGEAHLREMLREQIAHYHTERPHQGLGGALIEPVSDNVGDGRSSGGSG